MLDSVIAASILLAGITALTSSLGAMAKLSQRQGLVTAAVHAAEVVAEDIVLREQNDPGLAYGTHAGLSFDRDMKVGGTAVTTSYTVSAGPLVGTKRISVTATAAGGGATEVVQIVTFRR
jgi:hypothetical protein